MRLQMKSLYDGDVGNEISNFNSFDQEQREQQLPHVHGKAKSTIDDFTLITAINYKETLNLS